MVLPSEFGFQIPTVTNFSNDIAVAIGRKDFEASKDVWVIKFLEHVDL